jgi:hypothetical protein
MLVDPAFGEMPHLRRFVQSNGKQASAEKDALQMSGSMTDLENPHPFDEWNCFHDPVLPPAERDNRRDKVISEGKLVVKKVEEKTEQGFHKKKQGLDLYAKPLL